MKPNLNIAIVPFIRAFFTFAACAVVSLGFFGGGAQAVAATPSAGVQQFVLRNGMQLWVKPDHRSPTAVHMVWVRVGAMDENDGTSGVAHALEHLMFKGTASVGVGEFSQRVAALGGQENAFTGHDMTAFFQQLPSQYLPTVMQLEADRFANNQWADDEFFREMAVIKEERRLRVEDQPQAALFEVLGANAWMAHPYRRPVIGWMSDLDTLKPDDARQFYQKWYQPENAVVVVVGDVDAEQVRQWAEQYYGAIVPKASLPERKLQLEPTQRGMRRIEFKAPARQPYVALAYPVPALDFADHLATASQPSAAQPSATQQDALALLMLSAVLDGHSASRLAKNLVQVPPKQRMAHSAGAGYNGMGRGPAQFVLDAMPVDGKTPDQVAQALRQQVADVAKHGVTLAELHRVRQQWRAAHVFGLDSPFAQARDLGSNWINGWPPNATSTMLQQLQTISPEQVQAVAQKYFSADKLTQAVLLPDLQALAEREASKRNAPAPALRH